MDYNSTINGGCPFMNGKNGVNGDAISNGVSTTDQELHYDTYLHLDKILSAQHPLSGKKFGKLVHDEHLFITIHQAYELWFKQIMYEIDAVTQSIDKKIVEDAALCNSIAKLRRINLIWQLLNDQIHILETMQPVDFHEFRDYLAPSSGFQSVQFRIFESKFGIKENSRVPYNGGTYKDAFTQPEKAVIEAVDEKSSLFSLVERWLENVNFTINGQIINGEKYRDLFKISVKNYLNKSFLTPTQNETNEKKKKELLNEYEKITNDYESILDETIHKKWMDRGVRKLNFKAFWGALLIWLNPYESILNVPYQLLSVLVDMDQLVHRWRYNHASLVQRQVGSKAGTGGSSGYSYLKATMDNNRKVFNDILDMATWLIPKEFMPNLNA